MTVHMENENENENINRNRIEIENPFTGENFEKYWKIWKDYKKTEHKFQYKSAASEQAALMKLNNLSENNEEVAIKIIVQSLENGWKGFFELQENNNGRKKESNSGVSIEYKKDILRRLQDSDNTEEVR